MSTIEGEAPHELAVRLLTLDERVADGIARSPSRILVLTTDLDATLSTARDWIDRACSIVQVRDALVTNGVRWTTHRRGSRLNRTIWNLGDSIDEARTLESMLADLGEGL
ncbi:MAG: hypothetical protein ACYC2K_06915 [Gemmatimonadales bacterium]